MGYRKKSTLHTLKWPEGHKLGGDAENDPLEVVMKGASIGTLVKIQRAASAIVANLRSGTADGDEVAARLDAFYDHIAKKLVGWNLEDEDDGAPVPATKEGLAELDDPEFVLEVVTAWMEAITSVDTPLPNSSPDGGSTDPAPPGVESLPMDPLSPSPAT